MAKFKKYLLASLQDKPTELKLVGEDKKNKDNFLVIGSKSPRLKRAIATYGVETNANIDELNKLEYGVEKALKANELREAAELELSLSMVTGGCIDGDDVTTDEIKEILSENVDLVSAIIAHSFDVGNYTEKK